ncbi:MAG: TIGR01459 family HAD-type hydrolase [Burkholderiales bacterium]|nr:TIGR01459 family HAD-type hydrolase [Burkholderiales bacterium]
MSQLIARYDGFIVDQWGVLHDGVSAYPGACECVQRLHEAGKRIVILSNTGRSQGENLRSMQHLGFDPAWFDRFVGAGEDARAALAARRDPFHRALGTRCYAFTRAGDRSLIEGIGLTAVESVDDAEFLIVIGIDSPPCTLADYEPLLQAGHARGLSMVCANPDLVRVSPAGTLLAPGALAQRYEALGGRVFYHGKPYPAIYRSCLAAMPECPPQRVLAVGDSIEHDILGARRVGLASAFVAAGIHAATLVEHWGDIPAPERWQAFIAQAAATPEYLLPALRW